jgi:pyruvate,water dikinase
MKEFEFVRLLDEICEKDVLSAGGKGANLGAMLKAGLPVPGGFVLTVNSYQRFVEVNDLEKDIIELLAKADKDNTAVINKATEEIKVLFESGEIPDDIQNEIDEAYAKMGKPGVAVRSSSTAEDLPGASFAGQYSTFLNVKGKSELITSIKKCWASLWNDRVVAYRAKQKIGSKDLSHAVVVQKLIDSKKSGILFTANPINGRRDEISLNSSWGLGEAIVSGDVTPDQWVINKKSEKVVNEYIAVKKVMSIRKEKGIELVSVEPEKQKEITLNRGERKELLYLALKVEEYFGSPQDIEWAFADGKFYLVQSRPITSLYPMPQPEDTDEELRIYMNLMMYRQAMSAPITPMGIEFFKNMLVGVLLNSRHRKKPVRWFKNAGGRMFVDITEFLKFKKVLDRLESYKIPALMDTEPMTLKALAQVAVRNSTELMKNKKPLISLLFGMISKMGFGMLGLSMAAIPKRIYGKMFPRKAAEKSLEYGNRQLARLQRKRVKLRTIEEKLAFVAKEAPTVSFSIGYGMTFYLMPSFEYMNRAGKILKKYGDDTSGSGKTGREVSHSMTTAIEMGSAELGKLERAVPNSVTTEMGLEMLQMAKRLVQAGEEPSPRHPYIKNFLAQYGHRSTEEIDIGIPTWEEDPTYVISLIRSYMNDKAYQRGIEKFYSDREEAEKTIQNITARLKRKGAGKDARRVEKLLRIHRETFGYRELPKSILVKGIGIMRGILADVGEELKAEGRLDDKNDVFFLFYEDIRTGTDLKERVRLNREEYQRELHRTPVPRVMTSTGETVYYAATEDESDDAYKGIPASPGVYEGPVKVLRMPEEGDRLKQGEVLVAASTNPAWTPLFLKIGGLIMETGAPMSHGPVVAREYGIPAVIGVRDATTRLKDGQMVRINGETGRIEVISSEK